MHGMLKSWKKRIKINFYNQEILYDVYCNATAVLRTGSIYKQSKKYHSQVNVEECKYTDIDSQQCNIMSYPVDGDGYFEVQKEVWKRCIEEYKFFETCLRVTKN